MICIGPLTPSQKARSIKGIYYFNMANGFSYMCLGETIILLLAMEIGANDIVVTILGSMLNLGFTLLPLGRYFTARWGAAKTQSICWVLRNVAAVCCASSALWFYLGIPYLPLITLVLSAYAFYGLRAAGVVMTVPLLGELTTEQDRGTVIGKAGSYFYIFCFAALLLLIIPILTFKPHLWTLTGLIIFGSVLGVFASRFMLMVDETEVLRDSAKKPIWSEMRIALKNKPFMKLVLVNFVNNVFLILMLPISVAIIKRVYELSDSAALWFALCQFAASAVFSNFAGILSRKYGPRQVMFVFYLALVLLSILWINMPNKFTTILLIIAFITNGACNTALPNCTQHYFLHVVPKENSVAASILQAVLTGAAGGLVGMALGWCMIKYSNTQFAAYTLDSYKLYFKLYLLLSLPGLYFIYKMKPLPEEKRRIFFKIPRFFGH